MHVERSDGVASTGNNRHVAPATYSQRHARQVPLPHRPDPRRSVRRWPGRSGAPGWSTTTRSPERERAHQAGEKLSDTEVQRRVITLAKQTPERAWLAEVASVALVQACQDARRAYRNWFDSLSGKRKGRRVGHPGSGPSTAASRSGSPATASPCTGPGCTWPRSGDLRVRWSRRAARRCRPASRVIREPTAATTPRSWSSATRRRCRR